MAMIFLYSRMANLDLVLQLESEAVDALKLALVLVVAELRIIV